MLIPNACKIIGTMKLPHTIIDRLTNIPTFLSRQNGCMTIHKNPGLHETVACIVQSTRPVSASCTC